MTLDLKNFLWVRGHVAYHVLAVTDFQDEDVVVYRELKEPHRINVSTVSDFCKDFQATYEVS